MESSEFVAYNKLDDAQKEFFEEVQKAPFSEQAMAFLDAYWPEVGSQAPYIFEVAWEVIKEVDMQMQKCTYLHLYQESPSLTDFDWALLFFERLCKAVETKLTEDRDSEGNIILIQGKPVFKPWAEIDFFSVSMPTMMTAVRRKQELKDKVDFNQDGSISLLEYLIYQYKSVSNAADFIVKGRALKEGSALDSPERKQLEIAEAALEEVKAKIAAYQRAMAKQEEIISDHDNKVMDEQGRLKVNRVRRGKAVFELEELKNSGLANELKIALIDAEFKVKLALKMMTEAMARQATDKDQGKKVMRLNPGKMYWVQASVNAEKKRAAGYGIKGLIAKG